MPKRHHRKMRGGFLENFGSTLSNWGSSLSQGASNVWNKTKSTTRGFMSQSPSTTTYTPTATTSYTTSTQPTTSYTTSTQPTTSYNSTGSYGGRRTRRVKRGGSFSANTSLTGLAAHAAPFSGITAKPHTWVGGKSKKYRRGKKINKSRTHRKH